jgi:glycosyltransferase involved in cell wall biosynthesis
MNPTAEKRMPKIMHIITRLDMGGSAQNTLLTCRELAGAYETVLLHGLARESGMTDAESDRLADGKREAASREVKFIPVASLVRPINPVRDFFALSALLWHIWRERPDVVHTHTSKAGILGRLAARMAGVPHIVHTPHGHVFYGHFGRLTARLFIMVEKYFAAFTEKLVALTAGERRDYLDLGVGRGESILTIHSGVEIEEVAATELDIAAKKKNLGLDPAAKIIGFAGWLLPIKGPVHLLNAMPAVLQEHPDATLILVGKGNLEPTLRQQANRMGLDGHVRFLGWRDDLREIMPLFDVFVLPSLNEGMGRVLVEAMAAGRPIVASRVGGIPDLVRHGETGLLVTPRDEVSLAESISLLLSNPAKAGRMGALGRLRCREFSLPAMIAKLDALYRELLTARLSLGPMPPARGAAGHRGLTPPAEEGDTCLPPG